MHSAVARMPSGLTCSDCFPKRRNVFPAHDAVYEHPSLVWPHAGIGQANDTPTPEASPRAILIVTVFRKREGIITNPLG